MSALKKLKQIRTFAHLRKAKERESFLNNSDPELVREIVEIVANFLRGCIKLCGKEMRCMRYHRSKLRSLAKTKSYGRAKKILVQNGGWGGVLLPLLSAIASGFLQHEIRH